MRSSSASKVAKSFSSPSRGQNLLPWGRVSSHERQQEGGAKDQGEGERERGREGDALSVRTASLSKSLSVSGCINVELHSDCLRAMPTRGLARPYPCLALWVACSSLVATTTAVIPTPSSVAARPLRRLSRRHTCAGKSDDRHPGRWRKLLLARQGEPGTCTHKKSLVAAEVTQEVRIVVLGHPRHVSEGTLLCRPVTNPFLRVTVKSATTQLQSYAPSDSPIRCRKEVAPVCPRRRRREEYDMVVTNITQIVLHLT